MSQAVIKRTSQRGLIDWKVGHAPTSHSVGCHVHQAHQPVASSAFSRWTNDLSILMPACNECPTVEAAIPCALDAKLALAGGELIVVDHGSNEARELLGEPGIAAAYFVPENASARCRSPTGPRGRDAGKKLTAFDGVRVLGTLVRCRVM